MKTSLQLRPLRSVLAATFAAIFASASFVAAKSTGSASKSGCTFCKVPPPVTDAAPAGEITRTGVLESRVSIGGETTGWVLRYNREEKIEVILPAGALSRVREGAQVTVTGTIETRKFPERGEVRVLVVRKIRDAVK